MSTHTATDTAAVSARMPLELVRQVDNLAVKDDRTRSQQIVHLVRQGVRQALSDSKSAEVS